MAPLISNTSAEPTLYDILALTPKHLEGQTGTAQQQKIVKQAYRRALLKYHPDKSANNNDSQGSSTSSPSTTTNSKPTTKEGSQHRPQYTVDQIQQAYTILSDRKQRAEYDRELRTSPSQRQAQSASLSSFRTGVETVDLDDVSFDERTGVYYRGCRCGNARGYSFTEDNLEEFEDDGVLMVECLDCSLWVRVLFAAAEDEDDATTSATGPVSSSGGGSKGPHDGAMMTPRSHEEGAVTARGERRGSVARRGFTFNWSFNWGISLSGSATTGSSQR